jgi:hypothetical protein
MSPHFFSREPDRSVRLRLRLSEEEADLIEEAAGDTPLLLYIHRVLTDRARYHRKKSRESMGLPASPITNNKEH